MFHINDLHANDLSTTTVIWPIILSTLTVVTMNPYSQTPSTLPNILEGFSQHQSQEPSTLTHSHY